MKGDAEDCPVLVGVLVLAGYILSVQLSDDRSDIRIV